MSVESNLKNVTISSVVQRLSTERRSVALVIQRRLEKGVLYFEEGEIVHALLGPLEGEQAAFELLTWQDGTFRISEALRPPARSIRRGWRHMVLEAARQMGENERERAEAMPVSEPAPEKVDLVSLYGSLKPKVRGVSVEDMKATARRMGDRG